MEKTQTDHARTGQRNDRDLSNRVDAPAALALSYLTRAEFAVHQSVYADRILGVAAFGAARPHIAVPAFPYAWIEMPALNDETVYEVWTGAQTVVREEADGLASARNDEILFGCLQVEAGDALAAASCAAYSRIFDFIDRRGYNHLLRVWNYIPRINAEVHGLERYVSFNIGRHDAFAAKQRAFGIETPAACALGNRGDQLVIYFLASRQAGRRIENPRQISAFHYPPQYGPRSPIFARAMLLQTAAKPLLFVSGTASIVGHETQHAGDAPAQARETIANIQAVIAQAQHAGLGAAGTSANLLLKIYLRDPRDFTVVRHCVMQAFGPASRAVYLQADICRADLLLEIEAVYLNVAAALH
jgi:chorismate lyase/3-hydroxybenzoate synthase